MESERPEPDAAVLFVREHWTELDAAQRPQEALPARYEPLLPEEPLGLSWVAAMENGAAGTVRSVWA